MYSGYQTVTYVKQENVAAASLGKFQIPAQYLALNRDVSKYSHFYFSVLNLFRTDENSSTMMTSPHITENIYSSCGNSCLE